MLTYPVELAETLQPAHLVAFLKVLEADDAFLRIARLVEAVLLGSPVPEHALRVSAAPRALSHRRSWRRDNATCVTRVRGIGCHHSIDSSRGRGGAGLAGWTSEVGGDAFCDVLFPHDGASVWSLRGKFLVADWALVFFRYLSAWRMGVWLHGWRVRWCCCVDRSIPRGLLRGRRRTGGPARTHVVREVRERC